MSTNRDDDKSGGEDAEPIISHGGFIESGAPGGQPDVEVSELSDFATPEDTPAYKTPTVDVEGMESKTRRALAYGSGIVLAAFYTSTFVLHATGVFPDLGNIMSMFSGLQTLTAAAFGFYFAKGKGN